MKEQPTGKASIKGDATDWKRLRALSDKTIRIAVEGDAEARPTDVDLEASEDRNAPSEADGHYPVGYGPARLAATTKGLSDADQRRVADVHGSTEVITPDGHCIADHYSVSPVQTLESARKQLLPPSSIIFSRAGSIAGDPALTRRRTSR